MSTRREYTSFYNPYGNDDDAYDPYPPTDDSADDDASLAHLVKQMEMDLHDLAVSRLERKAAQARRDLGDAEIARRHKASVADWRRQQATLAEYQRELKAARQHRETAPPHPIYNPEGWHAWRTKRR